MVSSEFAAMLNHVVLPELRTCQYPTRSSADMAHYEQLRTDFAADIGVHWTLVHYAFFLSAENCRKQPWARALLLLLQPRESEAQMTQLRNQKSRLAQDYGFTDAGRAVLSALRQHISADYTKQDFQIHRTQPGAQQQLAALHTRTRDAPHRKPQQLWQEVVQMRSSQLQSQHGCTPVRLFWRMQAWQQPWMRTVQPEHWMPPAPCTPDFRQLVEQMVKNIKDAFEASLHSVRYSVNLLHVSTHQRWIREAVASKGNGAAGLHAITGSPFVAESLQLMLARMCCMFIGRGSGAALPSGPGARGSGMRLAPAVGIARTACGTHSASFSAVMVSALCVLLRCEPAACVLSRERAVAAPAYLCNLCNAATAAFLLQLGYTLRNLCVPTRKRAACKLSSCLAPFASCQQHSARCALYCTCAYTPCLRSGLRYFRRAKCSKTAARAHKRSSLQVPAVTGRLFCTVSAPRQARTVVNVQFESFKCIVWEHAAL